MIHIPIVLYHRIGPPEEALGLRSIYVSPRAFAEQMAYLHRQGYTTLSPAQIPPILRGERKPPKRPIVLTFDDGSHTVYTSAFPVLDKNGLKAVVFIVAGLVGQISLWCNDKEAEPHRLMSWEELTELQKYGHYLESHTINHPWLSRLTPSKTREELDSSKKLLEDKLGRPVSSVAYPYGDYTREVIQITQEVGYQWACSTHIGNRHQPEDLFQLKRVLVGPDTSLSRFKYRLSGLYDLEYKLKDK